MGANSTSWKPGQSGNPSGRPASVTRRLKLLDKLTTDEALARVWNSVIEAAINGDVAAARVVLDRVLGPTASLGDLDGDTVGSIDWRKLLLNLDENEIKNLENRLEPSDHP